MGSSLFPIAAIKHSGQKQLGEERVNLAYTSRSHSITEGNQGRNSRQKPEAGTDKMKLLTDLLSLLFNTAQVCPPRGSAAYSRLGSPRPIKEMSHRLVYGPVLGRRFLSGGSLFPDDPILCQVDRDQPA